jgi:hypothetical protein
MKDPLMRIRTAISYLLGYSKADLSALRRARRRLKKRWLPVLGQATANLQIGQRQKPRRAKEHRRSLNSEVVMEAPRPSKPNVCGLRSSATAQVATSPEGNEFLDDFEKKLRQRTRSPTKARTSPEPPSVIILGPEHQG